MKMGINLQIKKPQKEEGAPYSGTCISNYKNPKGPPQAHRAAPVPAALVHLSGWGAPQKKASGCGRGPCLGFEACCLQCLFLLYLFYDSPTTSVGLRGGELQGGDEAVGLC